VPCSCCCLSDDPCRSCPGADLRSGGLTTRCSDGSATQFVNGRWLYRPASTAQAFVWTWPFIIPARELRSVRQPRLVSPRPLEIGCINEPALAPDHARRDGSP
jgi:hypothetical protein